MSEATRQIGSLYGYSRWKTNPAAWNAVITGLKGLITDTLKEQTKPDLIVCYGSSGVFATAPLVDWLGKQGIAVFYLRKSGESSHGGSFEGPVLNKPASEGPFVAWMIDDMIDSGDTVRKVRDGLDAWGVRLETALFYLTNTPLSITGVRTIGRDFPSQVMQ